MRCMPHRTILLAPLIAALASWLASVPAGMAAAQADPPVTCQEVRDLGLSVSLTDRELTGGDETRFCLVARPDEDTFIGYVANAATADEFRAAKQTFFAAMERGGYETCRVGVWRPLNREGGPQLALSAADRLDQPGACPPRVTTRDPGADAEIERVTAALNPLTERVAAELGVIPHRPLSVDVYTDLTAVAAALRAARPELDAPSATDIARQGRSLTVLSPVRGTYMILNLTDAPATDTLTRRLAHEYTHVVQGSAAGTLDAVPVWFLEGQAEYVMEHLAGADWNRRADAARRERNAAAPHLPDLITTDAWADSEARFGNGVYSRGYGAIAFLNDRWGAASMGTLLRAASESDPARFDRTLTEITGLDLAGFDQALSEWLRSIGGYVTFYNDSPLSQRLTLPDDRTVDLPPCATCAFHRAADMCRENGRPAARLELPAGEQRIVRVVPNDRIHFPDDTITVQVEPDADLSRCLDLRVG